MENPWLSQSRKVNCVNGLWAFLTVQNIVFRAENINRFNGWLNRFRGSPGVGEKDRRIVRTDGNFGGVFGVVQARLGLAAR